MLHTICAIAGDNSAALLSLKENKCLLLASRQLFPIIEVRWRPLDDFLLLKCEDDSVYVWQMDTGKLKICLLPLQLGLFASFVLLFFFPKASASSIVWSTKSALLYIKLFILEVNGICFREIRFMYSRTNFLHCLCLLLHVLLQ